MPRQLSPIIKLAARELVRQFRTNQVSGSISLPFLRECTLHDRKLQASIARYFGLRPVTAKKSKTTGFPRR